MKTKFRLKQLSNNIFCIFVIAFHIHFGLCRPSSDNVDTKNILHNNSQNTEGPQAQVRPFLDLNSMANRDAFITYREDGAENKDTQLYSNKDLINFLSNDVSFIGGIEIGNDAFADDTPTQDDANSYVISNKEGLVLRHQDSPFTDSNLVRKRRHPESHRPHRRRRRKHKLVLKARDRNHLSDGEEDLKDRRGQMIIKSDGPAYVITSASEIKKDWCHTIPFKQKVSEPNCRSRTVQNHFCYGQCNSFFIPHTGRTNSKVAFQSCSFCKPLRQHWGNVTLNCPGKNPPRFEKTVLFVDECRCIMEVFQ